MKKILHRKNMMYEELYVLYYIKAEQSFEINKHQLAIECCKVALEYCKKIASNHVQLIECLLMCGKV